MTKRHLAASTCRLCGQVSSTPALTLGGMPSSNHRLLAREELSRDRPLNLTIYQCSACGFVSLPSMLAADYYSDYVNAPSASAQMRAFWDEQARDFIERFALQGRLVLEVGCGDGYFLSQMREHGAHCVGIEPSEAQRQIALGHGLTVEDGFLTEDRYLANAPFDAFVTRQVFEHVEDMHGFLHAIKANLRDGAVGLVEVPNLDTLLATDRFYDFIPEHLNYFSSRTLRLVLELNGFDVLAVDPVQDGEALRALVLQRSPAKMDGLQHRVLQLRADIAGFVKSQQDLGRRVAIWGAGGKGLSILAAAGVQGIAAVVDGDPHKHGRFTPVTHLEVMPLSVLQERDIGAVIIAAPAYKKEILRTLRKDMEFKGPVGVVGGQFEVVVEE